MPLCAACTSGREASAGNLYEEASAAAWADPSSDTQLQVSAPAPAIIGNPLRSSNTLQGSTATPLTRVANQSAQQRLSQPATAAQQQARPVNETVAVHELPIAPTPVSRIEEVITLDSPAAAAPDASNDDSWGADARTAPTGRSNQAVSAQDWPSAESRPPSNPAPACSSRNVPQAGTPSAAPGAAFGAESEHSCNSAGMDVPEQPSVGAGLRPPAARLASLSQMEDLIDVDYPATIRMHGQILGLVCPHKTCSTCTFLPLAALCAGYAIPC